MQGEQIAESQKSDETFGVLNSALQFQTGPVDLRFLLFPEKEMLNIFISWREQAEMTSHHIRG